MNKYQILEVTKKDNHAGVKAPDDVSMIASKIGYKTIRIKANTNKIDFISKCIRQICFFKEWFSCYYAIEKDAIVLLQNPFRQKTLWRDYWIKKLKTKKNVHYISLIHDVEELRGVNYDKYYSNEFKVMIELSDIFIVHNEIMKQCFINKGIPEEKIVILNVFDYLHSNEYKAPAFSRTVSIAGNLNPNKCKYISLLHEVENIAFDLYGVNYDKAMDRYKNINYKGSYPVDEIPAVLNEGFGLIWDGNSIDCCNGATGRYLKYNNPHKLSLYLSSGLPVIIWSKAAEATFVKENHLGICIDSLYDLHKVMENIGEEEYKEIAQNVRKISLKLTSGYYTTNALKKAEKMIT